MDRHFLRRYWNVIPQENPVSDRAAELGLQFFNLALGGRTSDAMLAAFQVYRAVS